MTLDVSVMMAFFGAWQFGQIMPFYFVVQRQFHFFRVHQHELDLRRMLFVQQRGYHGVQSYRFTLSRSAGHEQVRHFRQVEHHRFIGDILTYGNWQFHLSRLEFFRRYDRTHRHHRRFFVRDFYAYRTLARYRGYDTYAQSRKRKGYVVLKVLYLRHLDWQSGYYLVRVTVGLSWNVCGNMSIL